MFSSNCARDSHAIILRWIRSVKKFRYHCLKKFRYPQAFRLSLKSKFVLHHWFLAISVLACRQLPVHLYSLIYCRHPTNFIHIGTECIRLVYSASTARWIHIGITKQIQAFIKLKTQAPDFYKYHAKRVWTTPSRLHRSPKGAWGLLSGS